MKKLISTLTIFILCYSTISFVDKKQDSLENGFYYLAENEKESQFVNDIDSDAVFGIEKTPILTSFDFKDANISSIEIKSTEKIDFKLIEIKLTNNGKKKWIKIKNRISESNESIVFVFDHKVIIEKSYYGNNDTNTINLPIENKYVEIFLAKIKSEIGNYKLKENTK